MDIKNIYDAVIFASAALTIKSDQTTDTMTPMTQTRIHIDTTTYDVLDSSEPV